MMEYIVEFRVFRGDEGWHYTVTFRSDSTVAYDRQGGPYRTEAVATSTGLRALAAAINKRRTALERAAAVRTGRIRPPL